MKKFFTLFISLIVILCAFFTIIGSISQDIIQIPSNFKGDYIEIEGSKIRYYQIGAGKDILFIHGLPGSIEDWEPVEELSSKYRLTMYDRPGYGFSSPGKSDYHLNYNADIALKVIRKLNLENVIVVGHSYGGATSLAMAIQNPKEVKEFVVISAPSYFTMPAPKIYNFVTLPIIGRGLTSSLSYLLGTGMVKDGIHKAFHPNMNSMPSDFTEKRSKIWLQTKVINTLARERLNLNDDLKIIEPNFKNISKKIIIVHGDADLSVPSDGSIKLHKIIKKSEMIIFENTGHQVQFAKPDDLIKIIDDLRSKE
ncbi:MAG: alpha/beta hydrolase [Desulfobacterales bacterium]|nr:alpha/beta hydrolase [Desulfobacterales bacterium]